MTTRPGSTSWLPPLANAHVDSLAASADCGDDDDDDDDDEEEEEDDEEEDDDEEE